MFIYLIIMSLSLVGFFIHLGLTKEPKTKANLVEWFLLYQLVFTVGCISFLSFFGLTFMSQMVAEYLGWPYSPFEEELGNANLAFAVLGILCIWFRDDFWTATIIGLSVWLLADAEGHIMDAIRNHNYAPGNIGVPLFTDILVPIMLLILLYYYKKLKPQISPLQHA